METTFRISRTMLIVLILAVTWRHASAQEEEIPCPELYQRYSEKHTYCLPPNESCIILAASLSDEHIQTVLEVHNKYRSYVATGQESIGELPPASNMLEMEWDDELAEVAQSHANQCQFEHDCHGCREILHFPVGQNLYEYYTNYTEPPTPNWKVAIASWYDEVSDFPTHVLSDFDLNAGPKMYGHFTQAIWARTWRIGCGYTLFTHDGLFHELYTCNYGPGGNRDNHPIYLPGPACSRCPLHTCCGESCAAFQETALYDGLCKVTQEGIPRLPILGTPIFVCDFRDPAGCPRNFGDQKEWDIVHTLSGSSISVVLNGGEEATFNFVDKFKANKRMCMNLLYRKGPNLAGQEVANSALQRFRIVKNGHEIKIPLPGNPGSFTQYHMDMNWNLETELSFTFSVPPLKPAQYFELKNITVVEGACVRNP